MMEQELVSKIIDVSEKLLKNDTEYRALEKEYKTLVAESLMLITKFTLEIKKEIPNIDALDVKQALQVAFNEATFTGKLNNMDFVVEKVKYLLKNISDNPTWKKDKHDETTEELLDRTLEKIKKTDYN